jgi:hypothetical protein
MVHAHYNLVLTIFQSFPSLIYKAARLKFTMLSEIMSLTLSKEASELNFASDFALKQRPLTRLHASQFYPPGGCVFG